MSLIFLKVYKYFSDLVTLLRADFKFSIVLTKNKAKIFIDDLFEIKLIAMTQPAVLTSI